MSLVMPRAGTDPGRAARAGQVVPDETGASIANLGEVAAQVGTALENDRRDRNFQRAQVDLTREVNDLRLGVERIGDPDEADAYFQSGVETLRQRYLEAEGDDAVLDPANRARFGIAFDRLVNATAFEVGARYLGLRQSQREATYTEFTQQAALAGAGATPQTRAALFAQGDEMIASLLEAGVIDADEAAKRRLALRGDVSNAHAIRMINDDPGAFLDAAEQGDFPGLDADTLERYRASANSALAKARTDAQKEAERAAKARRQAIGDRLSEMRDIMGDGREAVDEGFLADPEVREHPDYARTMAARALREEGNRLALMTPAQIDALIAGEKTKKVARPYETERLELLQEWQARHQEGFANDPVAHAREVGHPIIDLPAFDPADPGAFAQALSQRAAQATDMVDEGYTDELRLLDDAERAELRAQAGMENDPSSRAALAQVLATTIPGDSFDRLSNVVGDPVFAHVGGLLAAGGQRAVAEEVLRGQQVISEGNVVLPPVRDRTEPAFSALSDFFADVPGGEAVQATITKSADALYAARIRRSDPAGDIDEDAYRQALHEVMGGHGAYDSRDARGGMQEVRDVLTPLPPGIGARDVDDMFMGLARDLLGIRQEKVPGAAMREINTVAATGQVVRPVTRLTPQEAQARANAFLQAVSVSGGQPGVNGEPLDGDTLMNLSLKAVGPETYRFVAPDGRVIGDLQNGGPYEFRLPGLVRRYKR